MVIEVVDDVVGALSVWVAKGVRLVVVWVGVAVGVTDAWVFVEFDVVGLDERVAR